MKCPRCATLLERLEPGRLAGAYPDVTIDRCPSCRGTWYDRGELDSSDGSPWTNVEDLPLRPVESAAPLVCPRCASMMAPVTVERLADLVLDRCPSCAGFWLDAGELPALRAYVGRIDAVELAEMSRDPHPRGPAADGAELLLFVVDGNDDEGDDDPDDGPDDDALDDD